MNKRTRTERLYLSHLAVRGLRDRTPENPPDEMDWRSLFELAGWNSLTGLTWHAVKRCPAVPDDVRREWEQSAVSTAIRRVMYETERELVVSALQDAGISVLPLKGASIAALYPADDMRSMADNDLMYGYVEPDEHDRWHVRGETEAERRDSILRARDALADIMPMLGYRSDGYETADITKWHDVGYVKPPFLRFEMHHSLIGQIEKDTGFFSDPWRFACGVASSDGRGSTLFLPKEVEYVYLVTHAHKHAVNKAIGIRFLADIQVYLDAWEKSMDWDEVSSLLRDSEIQDFESEIRSLTTRLFNEEELTEAEQALIVRMVGGGTFGTEANALENKLNEQRGETRHPRLTVACELLSPDRPQKSTFLQKVADQPLIRPLFPVFKLASMAAKLIRRPDIMIPKIRVFLGGRQP